MAEYPLPAHTEWLTVAVAFLQRRGYRDSVIAEVLTMPFED